MAADADGDFVVVWSSFGSTEFTYVTVQGQRYASDGSAVGGEFLVSTYPTAFHVDPAVAMDADGDFVVVWRVLDPALIESEISGQRFASDGSAVGGELQVNSYTTSFQQLPVVAMDADGDFVVVWESDGSGDTDTTNRSIQGQRFASNGSAAGGQFQVNTYTPWNQRGPAVAMESDGGFTVVWTSDGPTGSDTDQSSVRGQRYGSDGSALGGEFQVNTYTTERQGAPSVAIDGEGDFVVVWTSYGSNGTDSSDRSVQGQWYASGGAALGEQFQINTYTTGFQSTPGGFSVVARSGRHFVAVWESSGSGGTDTASRSIQMGAFVPIFADGFESGDTGAWHVTVP